MLKPREIVRAGLMFSASIVIAGCASELDKQEEATRAALAALGVDNDGEQDDGTYVHCSTWEVQERGRGDKFCDPQEDCDWPVRWSHADGPHGVPLARIGLAAWSGDAPSQIKIWPSNPPHENADFIHNRKHFRSECLRLTSLDFKNRATSSLPRNP